MIKGLTTCRGCPMELIGRSALEVLVPKTIALTPPGGSAKLTGSGCETGWGRPVCPDGPYEPSGLYLRRIGGSENSRQKPQVSFSSEYARETGQTVIFITERAVFRIVNGRVTLTEIAPGLDLQTQVLGKMEFRPEIAADLKPIDSRLFRNEKTGLSA